MQAGVQQYRFELVEMGSFFMGVVEDFAQEARERGYKVDVAEHPHLPPVQGDRDALARALWNLLDNAVSRLVERNRATAISIARFLVGCEAIRKYWIRDKTGSPKCELNGRAGSTVPQALKQTFGL
jgi:nitrogen-specific signal transduction histidine kinase